MTYDQTDDISRLRHLSFDTTDNSGLVTTSIKTTSSLCYQNAKSTTTISIHQLPNHNPHHIKQSNKNFPLRAQLSILDAVVLKCASQYHDVPRLISVQPDQWLHLVHSSPCEVTFLLHYSAYIISITVQHLQFSTDSSRSLHKLLSQ